VTIEEYWPREVHARITYNVLAYLALSISVHYHLAFSCIGIWTAPMWSVCR
jgi:hypothetical protein